MKALIMDGSDSEDQLAKGIASLTSKILMENGDEVETLILENMEIKDCMGCFGCWIRTPGICVIDDEGRTVAERMMNSDLIIWITPVTFGGYSYHLKKAVDRLIPNIHPLFMKVNGETHHAKRYESYPRLVAIGTLESRDEEKESVFRRLVARNAINMHSPSFSVGLVSMSDGEPVRREGIVTALRGVGVMQ